VIAAVLARRIDQAAESDLGTRWLNQALEAVAEFKPENSAAYFQSCLIRGLGELDPVLRDRSTAQMVWIRLTRAIDVPERWLEERREVLQRETG